MPMNYIDRLDIYCMNQPSNIWSKPSWYFKGDSDYWRILKSGYEASELAGVLRALTLFVGHIGINVGRVVWAGQIVSGLDEESIVLPASFVLDVYPVPPGKMDVLMGVTAHEARRQTEWSHNAWRELLKTNKELDRPSKYLIKDIYWKFFSACENIYLEQKASSNILGEYTRKAREVIVSGLLRDPRRNPTAWHLFDLWEQLAVDGRYYEPLNPLYEKPLDVLRKRTPEICSIATNGSPSVIARCKNRAAVYSSIIKEILPLIKEWQKDPVSYFEKGSYEKRELKKKKRKKEESTKKPAISREVFNEIEVELASGGRDLTPLIRKICNNDEKVIRTTLSNFTIPANASIDRLLVKRLKNIFYYYAQRVKKTSRGLESGKIDRRRLYRAPISGRCFKVDQMMVEFSWNFTVVVDASLSMGGYKWNVVENSMSALHKALAGYQNTLRIFGYFEWDGVSILSELLRNNVLYSIAPTGRTPSGQAIIGAGLLMPRDTFSRKFILHITDGESNVGVDVQYALDYCKQDNIDIITLGCGKKSKEAMLEQYGKSLQFIETIDQLPTALERLFQRLLKF